MNSPVSGLAAAVAALVKADPSAPALLVNYPDIVVVKAGTAFAGLSFVDDTPLKPPRDGFTAGVDYAVAENHGELVIVAANDRPFIPFGDRVLGGFHYAPGGNAAARTGGDDVPAINPVSCWDIAFRPACPDPRGMTLVELPDGKRFWADIYLCAADHLAGTSRHGATIADGNDRPEKPEGGKYGRFDYEAAKAVMAHHGKGLLSIDEFFAAAYGVTEKTAAGDDPSVTKLDASRTSKWGLIQATGNLWVWGHDGDPDTPRAGIFGGSWWDDGGAGSRCAVVDYWPGGSHGTVGARGRCDHLQLV